MKQNALKTPMLWNLVGLISAMCSTPDLTAQDSTYYWEQRMCTWSCLAVNDPSDHSMLFPWELEALQPKEDCFVMRRYSEYGHAITEWIPTETTSRPSWMSDAAAVKSVDQTLIGSFLEDVFTVPLEDSPPLFLPAIQPDSETISAWAQEGYVVQSFPDGSGHAELGSWSFIWSLSTAQHRWERDDSLVVLQYGLTGQGFYLSMMRQEVPHVLQGGGCAKHIVIQHWGRPQGYGEHDTPSWDMLNVSPTPSQHGIVEISLASERTLHADRIHLNDAQGRPALSIEGPLLLPYTLNAQELPPGHYSIHVQIGARSLTGNLIRL